MEHETETEASSMVSVAQGICHFKNWHCEPDTDLNTAVLIQTWDNDNENQSQEWKGTFQKVKNIFLEGQTNLNSEIFLYGA